MKALSFAAVLMSAIALRSGPGWAASRIKLGRQTSIRAVAVSPDGKSLAVIAVKRVVTHNADVGGHEEWRYDSSLQVWSIRRRKLISVPIKRDEDPRCIAFSPDGRVLACGSPACVQFLDAHSLKKLWTSYDIGGPELPHSIVFAPDGKRLVSGWGNESWRNWGRIVWWQTRRDEPTLRITGGKCDVHSVAYSPDGKTVVSGSWGSSGAATKFTANSRRDYGELRFFDAQSGHLIRLIKTPSEGINAIAFSSDGKLLATASTNYCDFVNVRVRSARSGALLHTMTLDRKGTAVAVFLPGSHTLAVGEPNGNGMLWDVQKNRVLQTFAGHQSPITAIAFVSRSRTLLTGSQDGVANFIQPGR